MSGVLAASLVSLFATTYMPFIKTQRPREDMNEAMYSDLDLDPKIEIPEEEQHDESLMI